MLSVTPIPPQNKPDGGSSEKSKDLPLTLPAILGRGPLLKCASVKVSRRHASLDWADDDDDGVTIEALFSQPTFVEVSGVCSKLKAGEKATLKHGDTFGLLPQAAWYRINLAGTSQQEANSSRVTEKDTSTPQDSGVEVECSGSTDTTDCSVQSRSQSNGTAALPDEGSARPTNDGASAEKLLCAEGEAVITSPPHPADVDGESGMASSETKKDSAQPAITTTVDVSKKIAKAQNDHVSDAVPLTSTTTTIRTPTATSSRARTLPSWMTRDPGTTQSSKPQPPATASKKKNTTRRKPRVKVAAVKRNVGQLSSSENEDDTAVSSPIKNTKLVSPNRPKNTGTASKRALHQLSESDDDDSFDVTATKNASPDKHTEIKASTSTEGASKASSAAPSANSSAKNTDSAKNNDTVLRPNIAKAKQRQPEALSGADNEEPGTVSGTQRTARNGVNSTSTPAPAPSTVKRKSCAYGASCYRRNPQHKKDEAHPGDPDYGSGGDDDDGSDDERPHCEYGVDCYRKNPEHRRQYKHTRIPQPQRRAKRKRVAQKNGGQRSDSDTPDEFDLDFLNDASSDDYAPTDSGDSDSEQFPSQPLDENEKKDLKRLGKDAKKFMRRGK